MLKVYSSVPERISGGTSVPTVWIVNRWQPRGDPAYAFSGFCAFALGARTGLQLRLIGQRYSDLHTRGH